jgi:hypothetical protein
VERTAWRDDVAVTHASGEAAGALVLGRYQPLRPLGSGGSGSVWLVRDERSGREVALKIVAREGKAGTRAEREAQAAARLRHPRCPRALALHHDDGHVYAAYEYVHGKTLREALRAGQLDDRASVEAAAQVLEALAHAHAQGIVHRDVKPANVMVEDAGEAVSVRLLDFGLAHIGDADTLTAVGDVPGTLAYIAPERLDGERATAAADVWSVGVVLWEALAGWHPFSAPSPVETARRIGAGAQPLTRSRPNLSHELCALVDRMLSLDPRRRPPAARLPDLLRSAVDARAGRALSAVSPRGLAERALPALLAAAFAGGAAWMLPFFPRGWPPLLAILAALVSLRSPRAGSAVALAVPVLPLGNLSLGLALAYATAALLWLALTARDSEHALVFVLGPLLAPTGALALLPALALRARGTVRRAAHAAVGVLAAAPFLLRDETIGIAGVGGAVEATRLVGDFLAAHPVVPLEAAVFAAAAAAAPLALRNGVWGVSAWGSSFLAAALLLPDVWGLEVAALPLVVGVWGASAALAAEGLRKRL